MFLWSALCIGLGLAGLVLSYFIWRSKGAMRGMRAAAWSLVPLAAYMTGSSTLLSRIGSAIARFAGSFVFSPRSWAGVGMLGLAALLFVVSGGLPLMKRGRRKKAGKGQAAVGADGRTPAAVTAGKSRRGADVQAGSEFGEAEEILRRHGIK